MLLVKALVLLLSSAICFVCLFFSVRLLEPIQDIFFGKIQAKRDVLRITLTWIFLMVLGLDFFAIAGFSFRIPTQDWTLEKLLINVIFIGIILAVLDLMIIPISLMGIFWNYFITGKFRDWLFQRLQEQKRKK